MSTVSAAEYKKTTEELYKKNLDLVQANRTLALLRKMYEIMMTTFNVHDVTDAFIKAIVKELEFAAGIVAIRQQNKLHITALTPSKFFNTPLKTIGKPATAISYSVKQKGNIMVQVLNSKKSLYNGNLANVWYPHLPKTAKTHTYIDEKLHICIAYPIVFGKKTLGSFVVVTNRPAHTITAFEKNVLTRVSTLFGIAIDRIMIYQNLQDANKKLKMLDNLKDEFISIASHDLRTPLATVRNYLWMLRNEKASPKKQKERIHRAYVANERTISLVNDMLDVSRIESGSMKLAPQKHNISQIITDLTNDLKPMVQKKNITVHLDTVKDAHVYVDQDRIIQVLTNHITNAIKYTRPGGTVTITTKHTAKFVETTVTDTGIGIKKKDLTKLFTKFGKLDVSHAGFDTESSTGLGLYISKHIIELSGGIIWVTSTPKKGSTFSFTLPRTKKRR